MAESAAQLPPAPRGYENIRLLGSGGFGAVTLARHAALGRLVAIKYLHATALADPDAVQRFRREAVVLAAVEDPTVVAVYDVRLNDPEPSIIMEYVPGEPLDSMLAGGLLSVAEMLVVLRDVATALEAAHAKGIAHRDVKPANVFVLPSGHAKLGDFGIARIANDSQLFRTSAGMIGGTPAYLPPEVAMGESEPDARSDVYSFAVMAYEMLTGRLPFVGRSVMGLIAAHASEPVPAPDELRPGFPPAASKALLAALDKDPAKRPSPSQLVDQLGAVGIGSWPEVIRDVQRGPQDQTRQVAATVRAPLGPARSRGRSSWKWPVIAGSFAVAGVVVAVVAVTGGGDSSTDALLAVSAVNVRASAASGRCPKADWTFTADIATNGSAGRIRLHWLRPDGRVTADQEVPIARGQRTAKVVLRFTVTGTQPLHGAATLHLLSPADRTGSSSPITYSC